MKTKMFWLILCFVAYSSTALADRCEDLARPKEFNKDSAMEAIFCEYNREHEGTLFPLKYTQTWNARQAEYLARPILSVIYRENNVRKGIIAIQRQEMESGTGEPEMSHAATAKVSVYVFQFNGTRWEFEKGKREVLNSGAHGYAPGGKLVKLGQEKYGLWFEGGDIHQGYTNDYAYIVALSERDVSNVGHIDSGKEVGHFDTGESNRGACSDDPKERDNMIGACWGYEGRPEFIPIQGAGYYMLRIAYQGTEQTDINDRDKIVPKTEPVCYLYTSGKYREAKDKNCANYKALDDRDIFGVGENTDRKQPLPSIPRKLLK